jgi:hypothetical protein
MQEYAGYISNFAFWIPGFDQFSRDFASFLDSGISATRKPGNYPERYAKKGYFLVLKRYGAFGNRSTTKDQLYN